MIHSLTLFYYLSINLFDIGILTPVFQMFYLLQEQLGMF